MCEGVDRNRLFGPPPPSPPHHHYQQQHHHPHPPHSLTHRCEGGGQHHYGHGSVEVPHGRAAGEMPGVVVVVVVVVVVADKSEQE